MPEALRVVLTIGIALLLLAGAAWLLAVLVLIVHRVAYRRSRPVAGSARWRLIELCRVVRDLGDLLDLF